MTDPTQRTRHRADRAPEEKAIDEWLVHAIVTKNVAASDKSARHRWLSVASSPAAR
jgi:hypothetical protein